jgi:probable rRNA maturation factor
MSGLALEIVGDIPADMSVEPLSKAFGVLQQELTDLPEGAINLAFIDDAEIRNLNLTYSGNDYATDVLSFDYREDGGAIGDVIGEIAISHETAAVQAKDAGTDLASEVALLGIHGVLHLLGYDHTTPEQQEMVGKLQADILTAANIPYREFKWES